MLGRASPRIDRLRDVVAGGASGHVLEVGCGTGANFDHYDWPRVESLVATEPDPFMLRRAEAKLRALPDETAAKVVLREAAAEELPFAGHEFDTVVVTLVLCTVRDLEASLREIRRVLRPGGELRLVEHVAAEGIAGGVQRVVQPVYGWFAAGCHLARRTEEAVRAAGFELEVMQRPNFGWFSPVFVGVARSRG